MCSFVKYEQDNLSYSDSLTVTVHTDTNCHSTWLLLGFFLTSKLLIYTHPHTHTISHSSQDMVTVVG